MKKVKNRVGCIKDNFFTIDIHGKYEEFVKESIIPPLEYYFH